jgi:hypothetical protein
MRKLWAIFLASLACSVLAGLVIEAHPHFAAERLPGAYAIYGFGACAALIVLAKALGLILKRPDTYYDD